MLDYQDQSVLKNNVYAVLNKILIFQKLKVIDKADFDKYIKEYTEIIH
jgi:hypothetical protein